VSPPRSAWGPNQLPVPGQRSDHRVLKRWTRPHDPPGAGVRDAPCRIRAPLRAAQWSPTGSNCPWGHPRSGRGACCADRVCFRRAPGWGDVRFRRSGPRQLAPRRPSRGRAGRFLRPVRTRRNQLAPCSLRCRPRRARLAAQVRLRVPRIGCRRRGQPRWSCRRLEPGASERSRQLEQSDRNRARPHPCCQRPPRQAPSFVCSTGTSTGEPPARRVGHCPIVVTAGAWPAVTERAAGPRSPPPPALSRSPFVSRETCGRWASHVAWVPGRRRRLLVLGEPPGQVKSRLTQV